MIVVPCSVRTMSEIASGGDVDPGHESGGCRAEEEPPAGPDRAGNAFYTGHLRTMTALSEMGAIIAHASAFYARPETIDEMVDHTVGRALDLFGIETGTVRP